MHITSDLSVAEVARALPTSIDVFESAAIDYCCRGAHSLEDAAADAGLATRDLIEQLEVLPHDADKYRDWTDEPLTAMVRFLANDHQLCIEHQMPDLRDAIAKAVSSHGAISPQLARIERIYAKFSAVITSHMMSEERDLLPH